MAVDIIVVRGAGDKRGADIVDGVLSTSTVAILRGVTEIQDNEPVTQVSLSTRYRTGVRVGQVVTVMDSLQGVVWFGKITGISHSSLLADNWTDLTIERPGG